MVKQGELREKNPWWKSKEKIEADPKIQEWSKSQIKLDPRLRHKINFHSPDDIIYTIRGPRQVGKTTLIKIQIRDLLLNEATPPWDIFYYALDLVQTPQEIVDIFETYQKLTRTRRKGRCFIFLDEVTSVPNWQKAIKSLVDANKLKNCTVLATGSQALNIKKDTERLPGRRGSAENYDKILLPMKFAEYVEVTNPEINNLVQSTHLRLFENRKNSFDELINLKIPGNVERLNDYQKELDDLLNDYLMTGGTPKVVDHVLRTARISEPIYTSYLEGILGDWSLERKNETLLRQLMGELIPSVGSLVTWYKIKRDAEMGSENTVLDYVDTLRRLFVISTFYRYGEKKKIPMIKDQKKIHFEDPFYLHLFNGWLSPNKFLDTAEHYLDNEENVSKLIEGVIGTHLIKWAFLLSPKKQTFEPSNHVFYWRDDKKKEVDYVLYDGGKIEVPIEVKYRNTLKGLGGFYSFLNKTGKKSGIVISKDELDVKENYVSIPASVFLMLI